MANFAIGVDLGGTNLRIAAVDESGTLLEKVTTGTRVALGRDQVINDMCDAIRALSAKFQASRTMLGAGIGVPGIIDMETGLLRESPNLPGWEEYPVREEIERRLKATVVLENDANAAAPPPSPAPTCAASTSPSSRCSARPSPPAALRFPTTSMPKASPASFSSSTAFTAAKASPAWYAALPSSAWSSPAAAAITARAARGSKCPLLSTQYPD